MRSESAMASSWSCVTKRNVTPISRCSDFNSPCICLRKQMQGELKSLQREIGVTFLFVTHDQEEAMALSDRIALLRDGALEQVASPREIYAHPATAYTAEFIGQTNLLRGEIRGGMVTCGALRWPSDEADGAVIFSLRPEAIRICADDKRQPSEVRFRAAVRQQ